MDGFQNALLHKFYEKAWKAVLPLSFAGQIGVIELHFFELIKKGNSSRFIKGNHTRDGRLDVDFYHFISPFPP